MLSEVLRCTERQKGSYRVICKLPEYPGWNISSSSDGDHEIGVKHIEDMLRGCLAEFVDLKLGLLAAIPVKKSISEVSMPPDISRLSAPQEERES